MSAASPDLLPGEDSFLAAIGRHWGLFLSLGIISVIVGFVVMFNTAGSVALVAILLGIWLFVAGVVSLVQSFTGAGEGHRVLLAISGICGIILGVMAFRSIWQAAAILAILIGIGWLIRGITMAIVAGGAPKGTPGKGWDVTLGVVIAIAGVVILVWPAPTLLVLAWVTGVMLVAFGVIQIVGAFQLRSAAKKLGTA